MATELGTSVLFSFTDLRTEAVILASLEVASHPKKSKMPRKRMECVFKGPLWVTFWLLVTKEEMQKHVEEFQKKIKENPETMANFLADDVKFLLPHYDAVVGKEGEHPWEACGDPRVTLGPFQLRPNSIR